MASWSDAKINMMDEKAEEDMKVLIGLSMEVVLDGEMMKADKEVDREVDEMLFQFAFLLIQVSTILLLIVNFWFQRRGLLTYCWQPSVYFLLQTWYQVSDQGSSNATLAPLQLKQALWAPPCTAVQAPLFFYFQSTIQYHQQ